MRPDLGCSSAWCPGADTRSVIGCLWGPVRQLSAGPARVQGPPSVVAVCQLRRHGHRVGGRGVSRATASDHPGRSGSAHMWSRWSCALIGAAGSPCSCCHASWSFVARWLVVTGSRVSPDPRG